MFFVSAALRSALVYNTPYLFLCQHLFLTFFTFFVFLFCKRFPLSVYDPIYVYFIILQFISKKFTQFLILHYLHNFCYILIYFLLSYLMLINRYINYEIIRNKRVLTRLWAYRNQRRLKIVEFVDLFYPSISCATLKQERVNKRMQTT